MTSNNNSNQWRYINMDNRIIRLIIVFVVSRRNENHQFRPLARALDEQKKGYLTYSQR